MAYCCTSPSLSTFGFGTFMNEPLFVDPVNKRGQASIFRNVSDSQNARRACSELAEFPFPMVVSRRKLALLAVPKCRRSAITLTENVAGSIPLDSPPPRRLPVILDHKHLQVPFIHCLPEIRRRLAILEVSGLHPALHPLPGRAVQQSRIQITKQRLQERFRPAFY
jgi:hypothetical protein